MPAPPSLGPGLVSRPIRVADADVVWLRSVLEAYDGLAQLYGDGTGRLLVISSEDQAAELNALLGALTREAALELL